jgi:drug/metabolite transporter (DMT)-like permease
VRHPRLVDLMLLTTVLLWALNFTVTKYVLTHGFHPLAYSAIRYGAAATIFAAVTATREGVPTLARRRDLLAAGACAVFGIYLNQLGYVYAIRSTTATTVALVLGVTPIVTALIARAVGFERLSSRFWAAASVSFGGVALVALGSGGGVSGNVKGDLLALFTATTWATYTVAVAPLMRRYSPFRISAIVLLAGWIPLAATGARQLAEQHFGHLPVLVWIGLVYALLGPLVLTNVLWFTAVERVGPSRATLFANIQPFFAALFALLILGESMTRLQVAGGLAIAAGIGLAYRRRSVSQAAVQEAV